MGCRWWALSRLPVARPRPALPLDAGPGGGVCVCGHRCSWLLLGGLQAAFLWGEGDTVLCPKCCGGGPRCPGTMRPRPAHPQQEGAAVGLSCQLLSVSPRACRSPTPVLPVHMLLAEESSDSKSRETAVSVCLLVTLPALRTCRAHSEPQRGREGGRTCGRAMERSWGGGAGRGGAVATDPAAPPATSTWTTAGRCPTSARWWATTGPST